MTNNLPGNPTTPEAREEISELPDADALSARMPKDQDIYRRVRDQALQTLAASASPSTPEYAQAQKATRLWAYLFVWEDFYGENLYHLENQNAAQVLKDDAQDYPLLQAYDCTWQTDTKLPGRPAGKWEAEVFSSSPAPPELKLACWSYLIRTFLRERANPQNTYTCYQTELPEIVRQWGEAYQVLIREKLPNEFLYKKADDLIYESDQDETALNLEIAALDRTFTAEDPGNPVKLALDGAYLVDDAWCARGHGQIDTVTDRGWQLFQNRLVKAQALLTDAFGQYPHEGEICRQMMKVCLGLQLPRDQEELWFQRAITINPNDYDAYWAKDNYLQPRWYGTEEDQFAFGQECIQTQNWGAKLPMIFTEGMERVEDADFVQRPDVWALLEKTYRDYLAHYPLSTEYRTVFAQEAMKTQHPEVARKQLVILGHHYDRTIMPESEHFEDLCLLHLTY